MNKSGITRETSQQNENRNNCMILKRLQERGEQYSNMLQEAWLKEKEHSDSEVSETGFSSIMGSIKSIESDEI